MSGAVSAAPERGGAEAYLAARVLNALLREDYGGLSARVAHSKDGVAVHLPGRPGATIRLSPGGLFQDYVVAPDERPSLRTVLDALAEVADPADAEGVRAFEAECAAALRALELHETRREAVLAGIDRGDPLRYETLAAFVDHPVYPTARARHGLSDADLRAYAPEFAPEFELRWALVPAGRVRATAPLPWRPPGAPEGEAVFPVHPLSAAAVAEIPGVRLLPEPHLAVRPTLSMRTVAAGARTHLKLPLATSTLGLRNRRSIKPGTLADGAAAELLLREIAAREPAAGGRIALAEEQEHAHAGHEYLAWMVRRLPPGEIVPVAGLLAPAPGGRTVIEEVSGGDVAGFLADYLTVLLRWNVTLFVRYGVALEAHQQNLALVLGDGPPTLLIKDNDGLLASPGRLREAGVTVPEFADPRMFGDDPHALADVFVTITLHLAAAAVAFGALPGGLARKLLTDTLGAALEEHGDHPMARLLRARTLDAARLVGKSMITAGTLVAKSRTGAADVNKYYGTSGPNYLRRAPGH
ncbi:siderophore synthetase component [Thermocatellispora tengchongensis]|uniref:Siderophore synthetase component n=1 Tax=Thermocatellispora tengchongensis TaxID=1073253 RepID=A0A840P4E6_9ACTN|nr:IucA/IucC family protein [Thermocatellispora tengchongensis]MBB5133869.1 siderophore synthetase component [Thermocatellispora tengchongensis]